MNEDLKKIEELSDAEFLKLVNTECARRTAEDSVLNTKDRGDFLKLLMTAIGQLLYFYD